LIHALADADCGAEVHHGLRPQHERFQYGSIPYVTFDILRLRVRVTRPRAGAVDLRLQVVEHRHAVLAANEGIDEVRTDVARATGHENVANRHV